MSVSHPESGNGLTVESAIANLSHPDTSLRYYAAWWLGKFRIGSADAVAALIEALQDEDDRTELGGYPLRRNAARALGKIGDPQAVPALLECLNCEDYYVRESAAQALGEIGDRSAIPPLQTLLAGGVEAAQQVPGRPHLTQPYEAVLEALGKLQANDAIAAIEPFINHFLPRIQYAAARAMYQLTHEPSYAQYLVDALTGNDVQLRRSALLDLGATGYLPATEAIAQAKVENSFKLISLKNLLAAEIQASDDFSSPRANQIMDWMDALL
ncbi:HEAT repeat domain-containing protein [Geitlerinema sp. PCC 9228]|jgi:phycocyanobilin lyase alpha subunit|uniref:HEAT repeat domain-containing protein n=1 Tax=Geitlerinema sp. PCC 9228 TaxID=111611 RepID=UPI0008F9D66A|nr:HEAT repeat domain-containing protein [Geitlerinema sp. PCC 9228]